MSIRLPDTTQHIAFAGRTGSGKTVAALELLASRDFHRMPWVIVDHKRDPNIAELPAQPLHLNALILPRAGLWVVRPSMSEQDRKTLNDFFERCFERENIGLYIDEGHLVGPSSGIRNILVAGRSKHVPLVWCSQRAHWIDSFIWSQAAFYRIFDLQTKNDIKRFEENVPVKWKKPAEYHSYYYDVSAGKTFYLKPAAPLAETVLSLDRLLKTQYRAV